MYNLNLINEETNKPNFYKITGPGFFKGSNVTNVKEKTEQLFGLKETWQLTVTRDSRLDLNAKKDIIRTTGETWMGSEY